MQFEHRRRQPHDGALQRGRALAHLVRRAAHLAARHFGDGLHQFGQALVVAGRRRHHAHAQVAGQPAGIDLDAAPPRLVHQVETHHRAIGDFQHLQHEVQIALEAGGIDHHHRDIGLTEQQEVACHLFIETRRQERVGARQVHELVALVARGKGALGAGHRLARPVAGVLAQARERVEDRALAGVRVAGQGHDVVVPGHVDAELLQIGQVVRWARGAGVRTGMAHAETSARLWTKMWLA